MSWRRRRLSLTAAVLTMLALSAHTDEAAPATAAAATAARPQPAEIATRASQNLLLAVTGAGVGAGRQLIAVGARGTIIESADGLSWKQLPAPSRATLTAVAFADAQAGWAVGHDAAILHTADGGKTWTTQNFQAELRKPLLGLVALDAMHVFTVGAYGLFKSTADGGASWTDVDAPAVRHDEQHLNAITRLGNGELLIVGEAGTLALSSAAADHWQRLKSPYAGSWFGALPHGDKGALVFGLRGNVYLSDDVHSQNWRKLEIGSQQTLFGGGVLPNGDSVLVGADGATVLIDRDGRLSKAEKIKPAGAPDSGTYSGAMAWQQALILVGEQGVVRVELGR